MNKLFKLSLGILILSLSGCSLVNTSYDGNIETMIPVGLCFQLHSPTDLDSSYTAECDFEKDPYMLEIGSESEDTGPSLDSKFIENIETMIGLDNSVTTYNYKGNIYLNHTYTNADVQDSYSFNVIVIYAPTPTSTDYKFEKITPGYGIPPSEATIQTIQLGWLSQTFTLDNAYNKSFTLTEYATHSIQAIDIYEYDSSDVLINTYSNYTNDTFLSTPHNYYIIKSYSDTDVFYTALQDEDTFSYYTGDDFILTQNTIEFKTQ